MKGQERQILFITHPFVIVDGLLVWQWRRELALPLTECCQPSGVHHCHSSHIHLLRLEDLLICYPFCKKIDAILLSNILTQQ